MTVGKDEWGGLAPSQARKDLPPPPHWRLEAVAAVQRPHHLRVSPDGNRLAFILDRADLGSDVWAIEGDGGLPVQLTVDRPPAPFWEDTAPSWSPDGRQVAYTSGGWVRLVPAEGGPSRRLVEAGAPRFVDSSTLVVSYDVDRERTRTALATVTEVTRLAVVDVNDPWLRPFTSPPADASDPDVHGRRVTYTVHPPNDRNRSDVVVIDLDRGEAETVAGIEGTHAGSARWSPDGTRLAFTCEEPV